MGPLLWGKARHTETSITLWACDLLAGGGELGVRVAASYAGLGAASITAGDTLGAGTDYTGTVTATGLSANTTYYYRLTLAGSNVALPGSRYAEGTFKTKPAAGEDVDLGFLFCSQEPDPTLQAMMAETFDAVYASEWLYIDDTAGATYNAASPGPGAATIATLRGANNPNSSSSAMTSSDFEAFRNSYRIRNRWSYIRRDASLSNRARELFRRRFPMRFVWDNHECWTTSAGNRRSRPGENQFDGAMRAWYEYHLQGNPTNPDSPGDTQPTRDGTNVHLPYFRETTGDVEVIVLDQVTYADMAAGPADTRTLFDSTNRGSHASNHQLAWATARIAASTAKFLLVMIGKPYQQGTTDYEDVSAGLLKAIGEKAGQTIVLISGDLHNPFARVLTATAWNGAGSREVLDNPVIEVSVGPTKHASITAMADTGYSCEMTGAQTYLLEPPGGVGDSYTSLDGVNCTQFASAAQRDLTWWNYLKASVRYTGAVATLTLSLIAPLRTSPTLWTASIEEGDRVPA